MHILRTITGLALFIFITLAGCSVDDDATEVDLSKREVIKTEAKKTRGAALRIALGGMITPREGFAYYKRLLDYIGEKTGREVEFVDREDYAEINSLLKAGKIDVAFVCGGPYVEGHNDFGMELLVAPYAYGGTVYYSLLIANKVSGIASLEDLRGKTFAFTDPMSNTGTLVPTYMLAGIHETPDSFFKEYDYTYAHDKSIQAVAEGIVDGAAVDSLIWEYAKRTNPKYTSRTKIIKKSPPYGIPPVVVRPGLGKELKKELRHVFLNIHRDNKGRDILKEMMIDKFVPIEDSAYDSIRLMKQWIAQNRDK